MDEALNRRGEAERFQLAVKTSLIDGRGLFAREPIPARRKLGEFTGELISRREARRRARRRQRIAIVELDEKRAIDGEARGNRFKFINHSCAPNAFIRICYGRVEFYSLRPIAAGEELTCNYGESHHDGKRRCGCGAPECRKFI